MIRLIESKIKENKKVISNQLENVSKAINSVATAINHTSKDLEDEKKEIVLICKQREIEILDIDIKKEKMRWCYP